MNGKQIVMNTKQEKTYWLDKKRNVNIIITLLVLICAMLFVIDFFYHRHAHFQFEYWIGFFCWFGFVVCFGLVLLAKALRIFLKRDEGYYDS